MRQDIDCVRPKCKEASVMMELSKPRSGPLNQVYFCPKCGSKDKVKTRLGNFLDFGRGAGGFVLLGKILLFILGIVLAIFGIRS